MARIWSSLWLKGIHSLRRHCIIFTVIPIINLRRLSNRVRFIIKDPIPLRRCNFSDKGPGGIVLDHVRPSVGKPEYYQVRLFLFSGTGHELYQMTFHRSDIFSRTSTILRHFSSAHWNTQEPRSNYHCFFASSADQMVILLWRHAKSYLRNPAKFPSFIVYRNELGHYCRSTCYSLCWDLKRDHPTTISAGAENKEN